MAKSHNPEFFYKYTTFDTAKIVLNNLTFRWSSPLVFNDPFDTRMDVNFDFDVNYAEVLSLKEIQTRIQAIEIPKGNKNNKVYKLILAIRDGKLENPVSEIISDLKKGGNGATDFKNQFGKISSILQGINEDWETNLIKLKVFCVSVVYDDLIMWAHYTKNHCGVVFRLKCLPKRDNSLCAADKVMYRDDFPIKITLGEWVDQICGAKSFTSQNHFKKQTLTKSSHWSYEKEWRIVDFRKDLVGEQKYIDVPIDPLEIDEIYLGCKMESDRRAEIKDIVKSKFPQTRLFQTSPHKRKFQLVFDQVS